MKITSLEELKTKVGHVIVMILLEKMFERRKMVKIATGLRTENRTAEEIFGSCWPHMSVSNSFSLSGCSIQQRPQLESVN